MYIKTLIKKSIGYLNIDRPESLNAMNEEVLDEFISKAAVKPDCEFIKILPS